jgi:hypothetical protein
MCSMNLFQNADGGAFVWQFDFRVFVSIKIVVKRNSIDLKINPAYSYVGFSW